MRRFQIDLGLLHRRRKEPLLHGSAKVRRVGVGGIPRLKPHIYLSHLSILGPILRLRVRSKRDDASISIWPKISYWRRSGSFVRSLEVDGDGYLFPRPVRVSWRAQLWTTVSRRDLNPSARLESLLVSSRRIVFYKSFRLTHAARIR